MPITEHMQDLSTTASPMTPAREARRQELIRKLIYAGPLTEAEEFELRQLQRDHYGVIRGRG